MANKITKEEFDTYEFEYTAHGNMGYAMDEHGNYTDRHKGYSYRWSCTPNGRVYFWERHYTLDDGGIERDWYVDGEKVGTARPWQNTPWEIILERLNTEPEFTILEFYCLMRMERLHLAWVAMIDAVAGCESPTPGFIDNSVPLPNRWDMVSKTMDRLREKGAIKIEMGVARRSVAL